MCDGSPRVRPPTSAHQGGARGQAEGSPTVLATHDSDSLDVCQTCCVRQRIRFCATPAGRVAYSVMGEGPFLICDTGWVSHLEQMLEIESFKGFFAALSERFSVVRFDKGGSGLSDREGGDITFAAQVA